MQRDLHEYRWLPHMSKYLLHMHDLIKLFGDLRIYLLA